MNLPSLKLNQDIVDIDDFRFDDIEVINYQHHPHISAPIAI
jgi:thymidylate synthase